MYLDRAAIRAGSRRAADPEAGSRAAHDTDTASATRADQLGTFCALRRLVET